MTKVGHHGRLGLPKSSTGCITCKKRRVKCDETKPICLRCTKANRECSGYAPWQSRPFKPDSNYPQCLPAASPKFSILNLHQDDTECFFFQLFISDASQRLTGLVKENFWTELVPQMSISNSAVRYGVIAVSSLLHHHFQAASWNSSPPLGSWNDDNTRLALTYYNRALNATVTNIAELKDIQVALVTCILFFCMEAVQGHEAKALDLFHQGQALLDRVVDPRITAEYPTKDAVTCSVDARVRLVFSRLRAYTALHQQPEHSYHSEDFQRISLTSMEPFASISDTRAALSVLMVDMHRFIVRASREKWDLSPDSLMSLECEQLELKGQLQGWCTRFETLTKSSNVSAGVDPPNLSDPATAAAITILHCHQTTMFVWMSCALSKAECAFDDYLHSFRRIVDLSSKAIDYLLLQSNGVQPAFLFELGVCAPLYFTASKCRDPELRRRALRLLESAPKLEGLWNNGKMRKVAARIIEIEEQDLGPGKWPTEATRIHSEWALASEEWPAEANRIHNAFNELIAWDDYPARGYSCIFMRKPTGLDDAWEVWQELFRDN